MGKTRALMPAVRAASRFVPARQMLTASVGDAILALLVVVAVGRTGPLWVGFGLVAGIVAGVAGYLFVKFRRFVTDRRVWQTALSTSSLRSGALWMAAAGRCEFAALAWSATLLSPTVATILFSTWPMMFILFLERAAASAEGGPRRYRRVTFESLTYFVVAFVGLAFVVAAQPFEDTEGAGQFGTAAGVGLAVLSALLAASNAFVYPWGMRLRSQLRSDPDALSAVSSLADSELEVAATMLGTLVSTLLAVPCRFVFALLDPAGGFSLGTLAATAGRSWNGCASAT